MANPTTYMSYTKPTIGGTSQGEVLDALLDDVDLDMNDVYDAMTAFNSDASLVANGHEATTATTPVSGVVKISNEVTQARFSLASLSAFLGVGHNADGTNIASSYSFSQFEAGGLAVNPVYVSATTFKFAAVDYTALLPPGIVLKLAYSGATGTLYFRVKDATFSTDTTVTVWSTDPAVVNQATLGETITATLGPVKPSFIIDSAYLRGSSVSNYIEYMAQSDSDTYYYDLAQVAPDNYSNPFGGTAAKDKTGDKALVVFGSGMRVGISYTALGGSIDTVVFQHSIGGVNTTFATVTKTYDPTTGYETDSDWS